MGGAAKVVSDVVSGAAKVVSSTAKTASKVVSKVATNVQKAVSNVVKNPLPVIETLAVVAVVGPYVGPAVAAAGGGTAAAAAATSAVSAAAVSAMNGGNVGDIATAAITSGAGGYAGQAAGTAIGAPTSGTELTTLGKITSSAVGGSTTTTLKLLADGSSLSDAVSGGAKVGVAAGITTGGIEGLKGAFNPSDAGTAPIEERSVYAATGESAAPLSSASDVYSAAQSASGTPGTYTAPTTETAFIGPTEERLLASALYPAVYSTLFGKQQQAPISATPTTTTQAPPKPVSPTQTTAAPGTQALAQALRVGDVGAPIFGGDKEEGKKAGWNVESLRYMGNSEA